MAGKIVLETKRLMLREAELTDDAFFLRLLNTPKWKRYIGDRGIKTDADSKNYIQDRLIETYRVNGFGFYVMVLKESGSPMGICGFVKRDFLDDQDFGFAVLPEYERQGYTVEAGLSMLAYGENHLGFSTILAITAKENSASQNLLKKLGFESKSTIIEPSTSEELFLFSKVKQDNNLE